MEDKAVEEARPGFSAFISYSHADAADVQKLHAKLEAYRLPKGLGQIDALNAKGSGLGKVFRDREDLSAAENLSDAVTDALSRSEVLIVACSPEAKASHWVGQEIAYFREHCPGRPILAAIMRGEPAEAFPDALTEGGVEPLAPDLRKEGDGWKLGFLKVVAGIAGVPLDALVQRESQRQMRRVMAVTGVVALLAIVMGVMTTMAIQARNEAQQERDAAEGLVGYMMTDLRDDLRKVGSIDTMAGVSARALEYYGREQDLSSLATDSLLLRSKTLQALGEDLLKHKESDKEAVRDLFREAYRTTQALYARKPKDPDIIYQHAQSAYWVGQSHYFFREWSKVEEFWTEYLELGEALDAIEDGSKNGRKEVGYARGNLCTLALHRDDKTQDALPDCQRSADIFKELSAKHSDDDGIRSTFANRLGWLADAFLDEGRTDDAVATYRLQHAEVERLHQKEPDDASRVDQLMRAKMTLGEALGKAGENGEANQLLNEARSMAARMVQADPNNQYWQDWVNRLVKQQTSKSGAEDE